MTECNAKNIRYLALRLRHLTKGQAEPVWFYRLDGRSALWWRRWRSVLSRYRCCLKSVRRRLAPLPLRTSSLWCNGRRWTTGECRRVRKLLRLDVRFSFRFRASLVVMSETRAMCVFPFKESSVVLMAMLRRTDIHSLAFITDELNVRTVTHVLCCKVK